jgi:hypothetical protein
MSTQVTAAFITPTCRANRGDEGAWDEAVDRLRREYDAIIAAWGDRPAQPILNLILTMDRPLVAPVDQEGPEGSADE